MHELQPSVVAISQVGVRGAADPAAPFGEASFPADVNGVVTVIRFQVMPGFDGRRALEEIEQAATAAKILIVNATVSKHGLTLLPLMSLQVKA